MDFDLIVVLIFSLLIPLVLLVIVAIYLQKLKNYKVDVLHKADELEDDLTLLQGISMEHVDDISLLFAGERYKDSFGEIWKKIVADSKNFFGGRWLPPLRQYFNPASLESPELLSLRSYNPAILTASVGGLAALVVYIYLSQSHSSLFAGLALIPAGIGLFAALFLANAAKELRSMQESLYQQLYDSLSRVVPVYENHNGVALLVEEMLSHESRLQESIDHFTESSKKMAETEFSAGICRSVREIMSEELTPPIVKASSTLQDLAENLDRRQMTGMENLADEFAGQVAEKLARHFDPLNAELVSLNRLMGRTKDFIQDSITVLQTSREQNIVLNEEITDSLKLMTIAKNDLANEMAQISDNIAVISETSAKMAKTFSGEEDALSEKIKEMSGTMRDATQVFAKGLKTSSESLEMASRLKIEQEKQYDELSLQISQIIVNLEELDTGIRASTTNFTTESSVYVNETLKSFDEGLAEVVERLIFTATSLRDAVDALPAALRKGSGKDF